MKHPDPVIKKNTSFSILLLRDDSGVVKFRLDPFWIKLLMVFFFCFSAASGAAGYAAHYYWKKYHALQLERTELAAKLGENRRQLGRFAGIEKIKEFSLPRSAVSGVALAAGPEQPFQEPVANGAQRGDQPPSANGETTRPDGRMTTAQAPAAPPASPPPPALPALPATGGTAQLPQTAPETTAAQEQPATSARPTASALTTASGPDSDTRAAESKGHPAAVDDVQIRALGAGKYRLAFDLSNRDQQFTLNGRVHLHISTKSDSKLEVTQINRDSLRFLINRFKKVNTTFSLPPAVQPGDVTTVHLTVTAEKVPDVTFDFPFLPQS